MIAGSTLRLATSDDAEAIVAIYAPFVLATHVSFEEVPPSDADMRATLAAARGIWPWIVCERAGAIAGFAYASPHRSRSGYRFSTDTSVYVHERHRRTGVASLAYGALFRLLALQSYYNAFAGIALPNEASVALHERLGFRRIARYENVGFKAGGWHDTLWLQRALRPLESPPREPLRLDAIGEADRETALATH